jgi:hypothetical protein
MKRNYISPLRLLGVLISVSCFSVSSAFSRPVNPKSPNELFEIADTVINGEVISVHITDETSSIALGANKPLQIRIAIAKIQQLASFKGSSQREISLRYPVLDRDKHVHVMNGPNLPNLQTGERYHFYLSQVDDAVYETALNDDFDSGFSIHHFANGEDAKSPPLFKEEAERLAVEFFEKHRDLPLNSQLSTRFREGTWTMRIFVGDPVYYPTFTFDARIRIDTSRQITSDSVVGREVPRKSQSIDQSILHTEVRLTVSGFFRENEYQAEKSNITELVGRIDSVSDSSITGTFSSQSFDSAAPPQKLSFPSVALESVQRIFTEKEF